MSLFVDRAAAEIGVPSLQGALRAFIGGHIAARTGAGTPGPNMERSRTGHTGMDTRISPSMDTRISRGGDTIAIAITSSTTMGTVTGTGHSSKRARSVWE